MKQTAIHLLHQKYGATLTSFHGWELPIQYHGIIAEHLHTRTNVSLFDVSHMGEFLIPGPNALKNVQYFTPNDVTRLQPEQAQYSALLYQNGTFVDDITVYCLGENTFQFCVNASNIDKGFAWIQEHKHGDVQNTNISEATGQIAIQGPYAEACLQPLIQKSLSAINYYHFIQATLFNATVLIALMGYTGEDGFEIFFPHHLTTRIWEALMDAGSSYDIQPVGLGARDTLRIEAGFHLYGNDIDDQHTAIEAGLGWVVKFTGPDFIGREALQKQKEAGVNKRFIRFVLMEKGVPRASYKIYDPEGKQIGVVTSGNMSPSFKQGIGMGYIEADLASPDQPILIDIRKHKVPAKIIKGSFIKALGSTV